MEENKINTIDVDIKLPNLSRLRKIYKLIHLNTFKDLLYLERNPIILNYSKDSLNDISTQIARVRTLRYYGFDIHIVKINLNKRFNSRTLGCVIFKGYQRERVWELLKKEFPVVFTTQDYWSNLGRVILGSKKSDAMYDRTNQYKKWKKKKQN